MGLVLAYLKMHFSNSYERYVWAYIWSCVLYRYIVHSDDHNPYLASMEHFAEKLKDFNADLLVVGGLQMMDSFPFQPGERKIIPRPLRWELQRLLFNRCNRLTFEFFSWKQLIDLESTTWYLSQKRTTKLHITVFTAYIF